MKHAFAFENIYEIHLFTHYTIYGNVVLIYREMCSPFVNITHTVYS